MKRILCVWFPSLGRCEPGAARAAASAKPQAARLALWCQCFSPVVAVEEPDSLFLDITGCQALFGGEWKLASQAVDKLQGGGFSVRAAIADTPGAAWAMAHHQGAPVSIVPAGGQRRCLAPLPVEALRLEAQAVRLLHEFDICRIEQLQQLPRAVIPARFGTQVLRRLDQALGESPEPLTPETPPETIEASWSFEFPCSDRRTIETVLEHLLEPMLAKLHPRGLGIERLLCKLHVDREPWTVNRGPWTVNREPTKARSTVHGPRSTCLPVGLLHASDSLPYLMELIRLHLDRVRLPGAITAVGIQAVQVMPLEFSQGKMFADDQDCRKAERWRCWPRLVELLSSRLGKEIILRPDLYADAQPERAYCYKPCLERAAWTVNREPWTVPLSVHGPRSTVHASAFIRPLSLQPRPVAVSVMAIFPGGPPLRFAWENENYVVAHCWGPERIETGWWRGEDIGRDYYLVETTTGARFWLFRTATGSWFLHGAFA